MGSRSLVRSRGSNYRFKAPFADRLQDFPMLVFEKIVHLLLGKIWTGDLVGVRRGSLAETAPSHEHHALERVRVRVGLTLYVIDRVAVFHIGIKAEDHLARCNLDEKLVKTFALSAICTAPTLTISSAKNTIECLDND